MILEPSGWDAITIGYKGTLRLRLERSQAVEHGASPHPTAADHLIGAIRQLQDHANQLNGDKSAFERLDVKVFAFRSEHDGLLEHAHCDIGLRLPPDYSGLQLTSYMQGRWSECQARIGSPTPAVRTPKGSRTSRAFIQAIRAVGGTPRFKLKTGTSDMNLLVPAWGCPTIAYGPGDSSLDHTPEESIGLDELALGTEVLHEALVQLC